MADLNNLPPTKCDIYKIALDGKPAYPWQTQFAAEWPEVLIAPTGSGKTAGVTLGWIYRRLENPVGTPRRLVWCLPMRTLVEQVEQVIKKWLERLAAAKVGIENRIPGPDDIHILMGGVKRGDWTLTPEKPAVLVGTQDMLLSRALMRGYGSFRKNWPIEFALLHHDTQWVFDEVQLMGAGRTTSTQLEAFRRKEANREIENFELRDGYLPARSLWISATLKPEWLKTIDFPEPEETKVMDVNSQIIAGSHLDKLSKAKKNLSKSPIAPLSRNEQDTKNYADRLSNLILDKHIQDHLTLVIVNRVNSAQQIFKELNQKIKNSQRKQPKAILIHSHFRKQERKERNKKIKDSEFKNLIVISTQAVEAGVDISAAVLFSELAPWPSMVQRFGRANRYANLKDGANVFWIDIIPEMHDWTQENKDSCEKIFDKLNGFLHQLDGNLTSLKTPETNQNSEKFKNVKQLISALTEKSFSIIDLLREIYPNPWDVGKALKGIGIGFSELKSIVSKLQVQDIEDSYKMISENLSNLEKSFTKSLNNCKDISLPYSVEELVIAKNHLSKLTDVCSSNLLPPDSVTTEGSVIRRKDMYELFDTDADLTDHDIDISIYVRGHSDTDVRIFWRELSKQEPQLNPPNSDELCSVPIANVRNWLEAISGFSKKDKDPTVFVSDRQWAPNNDSEGVGWPGWKPLGAEIRPGQTLLVDIQEGGYNEKLGFTGNWKGTVSEYQNQLKTHEIDSIADDHRSSIGIPVELLDHLGHVFEEGQKLCRLLDVNKNTAHCITRAALWHDLGKAHPVFQATMRRGLSKPDDISPNVLLAKNEKYNNHCRRYFRHELVSALAYLSQEGWSRDADLVAYLIAAHHGKVRMSIRAFPQERKPSAKRQACEQCPTKNICEDYQIANTHKFLFARGVWQNDKIEEFDMGMGNRWKGGELSLSIMELGDDTKTKESWTRRMRELLIHYGPFRLAWMETLVRIADWRASEKEKIGEYNSDKN